LVDGISTYNTDANLKNYTSMAESITKLTLQKTQYQPQARDTNIEADIYLFAKLQELSIAQRIQLFIAHDQGIKKLCLAGIKFRHPHASLETIRSSFACAILGEKLSPQFQSKGKNENMWIQDSIALAGELHQLLTSINIPYYVSGGVASSIHGEPRSSRDLDLVIEIQLDQIDLLVDILKTGYYFLYGGVEGIKLGRERMLNITHTEAIANADLYITDTSPFAISQMQRRLLLDLEGIPKFWLASPEDIILQKLRWGKDTQSEKQWRDVLGILKLQASSLDQKYLAQWAKHLDLSETLTNALNAVSIIP